MLTSNPVILIVDPLPDTSRLWQEVADKFVCDRVEAHSLPAFYDCLATRHPTIVVIAVDSDIDGLVVLHALADRHRSAAIFIVGSLDAKLLASITRTAMSLGLEIIGSSTRPLDAENVQRAFAGHLGYPPTIRSDELEQSFAAGELALHYHPTIALSCDGPRLQGAEAIVVWKHPKLGMLVPRQWLKNMERSNLLSDLTDFVMIEALRQAGQWHASGTTLKVSMSISPRLMRDRGVPDRVAILLGECGLPADQLILNFSEMANCEDFSLTLDIFSRLRALGIKLSLDKIGMESMSLSELYRFPYTELKLAGSLVADAVHEPNALVVLRAVVDLAHSLGLRVGAAGIDSPKIFELVKNLGIDSIQGGCFFDPMPAAEIERIARTRPAEGPLTRGVWSIASTHGWKMSVGPPLPLWRTHREREVPSC
jgi:EAL domain-containing protein (putative c-di-GMP-specific phosphodiesterase class I)